MLRSQQDAMAMNRIPEFISDMAKAMRNVTTESSADGLLVRLLYYAMVDELGREIVHRELRTRMKGQR